MRRRPKREAFADVVAQVKSAPTPAAAVRPGPSQDGESWGDLAGNVYRLISDRLDPDRAVELVQRGALVVYDSCGCGGECGSGLDWLTSDDLAALAHASAPLVGFRAKTWGRLAEWQSDTGQVLIEAAVNVKWGTQIQG